MKFALFLVLSLSALAAAGPAFTKNNQIENQKQQPQQGYMTTGATNYDDAKSPTIDILKQWCFSSQLSQQELTASFKKLVGVVKSSPVEQTTEAAVMGERICQGALVQKSQQSGQTYGQTGADAKAHELIKDVYMDALIACKSRECTQQLLKVISSQQVDAIRASYYMTRIAVTDKQQMKDEQEVKQFAESFIQQQGKEQSEAVERQKLFATTSIIGKWCQAKPADSEIKAVAHKVAQSIVERYIKPVQQQEVQQYKQTEQPSAELAKKIAKRAAAIKALANIPGHIIAEIAQVEQTIVELAKNKEELVTVRQSAIECLEQNEEQMELLKQIAFEQEEPIECRVAAYRALMTVAYQGEEKSSQNKEQIAQQILEEVVKHCEQQQQQDEQFVLYAVSHLENLRTSQQPEHQAIKQCISNNKQHYMQIQVLSKKLKQQLNDVRRSSRNYKLEQEFNQLESGLVLEGDIVYESQQHKQSPQQVLPKLVRVNMSMPIMGETVNVIEVTLRQNQMDEELLGALKMVQNTKFNSESVNKVVDSFKSTVEKQQQQQQQQQQTRSYTKTAGQKAVEADLTIKVDGCTVVYLCADDIKAAGNTRANQRNTRSVYSESLIEEVIEFLKRQPINFNRGFNVNINERIARLLDVDANILAGLRFESRAQGTQDNLEIVAQMEPRFGFEAVVGPAKMSTKKLLQRFSTKTAAGLRLRFKKDELVDIKIELPMNQMELFTVESQLVEKSRSVPYSYNYLPESIYGQEDIYTAPLRQTHFSQKLAKRSIYNFGEKKTTTTTTIVGKLIEGKSVAETFETPEQFARATGLRGKLRVAASPKDMSYLLSCMIQKDEPSMEGIRVRIEKAGRQGDLEQYLITLSTPGSRTQRTVSIRVAKQMNQERSLIKAEFQAPRMAFAHTIELIHDGRQYALKSELVSRDQSRQQWRHALECGIVSGSQAASGRLAQFALKPFLQLESTLLKRPIALQGQIAYQQSPKSVISYELKCPTTGDFVQGKLIVDQRDTNRMSSAAYRKRTTSSFRRSAQSPIELLMSMDITLTHEMSGQVQEHVVKVHNMADWSCQKYALEADSSLVYKNLKKSASECRIAGQLKINEQQQLLSVERKSASDERNNYALRLNSIVRPAGHQMEAECRFNGRRQSLVAYKHRVEVQKVGQNKYDCQLQVEFVDTEQQINEKFQGRARLQNERRQKSVQCELASRQKQAKVNLDFESLAQHQLQVVLKCDQFEHKCELRNSPRQFFVQSRTEGKQTGQMMAKMLIDYQKPTGECKLVVEVPAKRAAIAADLKLESGKRSSLAIQTPRFATQGEFTFETVARPFIKSPSRLLQNNLRFRSSLKDLVAKKAYWMDSAINAADMDKESSFIRFDSPIYRTDVEFDPREQVTKIATFARSKRAADHFDSIYSTKDSSLFGIESLNELSNKLNLGNNKLWMLRSVISSPFAREQLKQQARRALFQYADRVQSHQHQFNWSPVEKRLSMELNREPNTEFVSQSSFAPLRAKANWHADYEQPATMSLSSEWMDMDMEMSPVGQEERFAKISAQSRHPRSAFKKHESEIRYNKDNGYKAYMKHQDSKNKEHKFELESDVEPHKYAKMAWNSEKHGKAQWEHKWRKEQQKRSFDDEPVYKNKLAFKCEGPSHEQWQHETTFDWEEPVRMAEESRRHYQKIREQRRHRRSYGLTGAQDDDTANWSLLNSIYDKFDNLAALNTGRYSPVEYLKHTNARLVSSQGRSPAEQLYKLDFDYQPSQNYARLNVNMPEEMLHSSALEFKPDQKLYKLQSKLYNRLTKEPSYEFVAATKPFGLATAEQEPIFVQSEHPMFERPIAKDSLVYTLFKQPLKIDYSDKSGRLASLDYDHSPIVGAGKYAGLRQKRAAVYYKDEEQDIEHTSSYDFYPETFMGKLKPAYYKQQQKQFREQQPRDVAFKTQTKYGPIVVRADSTNELMIVDVSSPVVNAKLVGETGANMRQLIKLELDNKQQRVQLSKLIREAPATIGECKLVKKFARKFDSGRFEHKSELLVSIVDAIFKLKSETKFNERPVIVIEGEWNEQQQKAVAKVNGERINGQAVLDLVRKSADLVLDVDDKHTLHHVTRLVRTSDKFYSLDSITTHKSRPLFKLAGKVSSKVFEPAHLFARRSSYGEPEHVSHFEAVIYEPREYRVNGQFDCDKKEARIVVKNVEEEKVQESFVRFDEQSETIFVDSRLNSRAEGQVYATKAKLSLPGLYQADECLYQKEKVLGYGPSSCQSDVIYMDKSGNWSAKYVPGEYVAVSTPQGKQTINLAGYVY